MESDTLWIITQELPVLVLHFHASVSQTMEKVLINVDRYGNTSAATIPTVLDEAVRSGKVKEGQTVLLDCFGAGLTYGAVLIRW